MGFRQRHPWLCAAILACFLYGLGCVVGGIGLAEFAIHPPRDAAAKIPTTIFPRYLEISEEPVEIQGRDGAVLRATYAFPNSNDNGNTVIVLHGVADERSGMIGFARLFLSNGYRVLLPDSRAQGVSQGRLATYGVLERDDVHRWLDWVTSHSHGSCVYGLGESMGAAILLQAIAVDHRMCAAVAESTFATFRQISDIRVGQFTRTGPWMGETLARPMIDVARLYVRLRYGVDLSAANPIDGVRQSCTPVLLIHGEADSNIPASSSAAIHSAAQQNTELWLVPGAGHCGASTVNKRMFDFKVLGWFRQHTGPCG